VRYRRADHAAGEAAFVQQLDAQPKISGERLSLAADHDRHDEALELVDQLAPDRLGGGMRHAG
jgi:hypothetical protein